jgi:hypothetical protein
MHRDWGSMKAPVILVTATLTIAILLAASLLIATGRRGENPPLRDRPAAERISAVVPAAKYDDLNQTIENP